MTILINLFAQPSAGKTTTAHDLTQSLKYQQLNVEFTQEYVKKMAYTGTKIEYYHQPKILAREIEQQFRLIGKVDYIISDSPILLAPFYQDYYHGSGGKNLLAVAQDQLAWAEKQGCEIHNFFLSRNKPYNPVGRYQSEEQADQIGNALFKWLDLNGIEFHYLDCDDKERVPTILSHIQKSLENPIDILI